MSDLDFDELDKAVEGMMDGKNEGGDVGDGAKGEGEVEEKVKVAPVRKRGRFMDMVHPSSDMRAGAGGGVGAPVKREEVVEEKTEEGSGEESSGEEVIIDGEGGEDIRLDEVLEELSNENKDGGEEDESEGVFEEEEKPWVEVLDEGVYDEEKKEDAGGDEVEGGEEPVEGDDDEGGFEEVDGDEDREGDFEDDSEEGGDTEEEKEDEIDEVISTPFIPGAKIDKRPLGGVTRSGGDVDAIKSTSGNFSAASVVDKQQDEGRSIYDVDEDDTTMVVAERRKGGGWVWLLVVLLVIVLGAGAGVGVWYFVFN